MTSDIKAEIGSRIRERRLLAGYTREQLSEYCDRSPRFIANLEFGDSSLSLDTLMLLCRALSCSSDYILFGSDPEAPCLDMLKELREDMRKQSDILNSMGQKLFAGETH